MNAKDVLWDGSEAIATCLGKRCIGSLYGASLASFFCDTLAVPDVGPACCWQAMGQIKPCVLADHRSLERQRVLSVSIILTNTLRHQPVPCCMKNRILTDPSLRFLNLGFCCANLCMAEELFVF